MTSPTPVVGDIYGTLGLSKEATTEDIKKAFRKLARECHPDVAGDDPASASRFDKVRKAYEILVDPEKRMRYDRGGANRRLGQRTRGTDGYRMPGGLYTRHNFGTGRDQGTPNARTRKRNPENEIGLDDLMGDFGFGGGGAAGASKPNQGPFGGAGRTQQAQSGQYRPKGAPPKRESGGGRPTREEAPRRDIPGRDISMVVDVPADIAARGGTITLCYPRMRRTEDGRGVARYDEIHDLRVPPGVRHGDTLRSRNYGDAGDDGTHGDLVCDIRVVDAVSPQSPPPGGSGPSAGSDSFGSAPPSKPAKAAPRPSDEGVEVLPIRLVEALLGGRVPVDTASGRVLVTIRPGTSEGSRLRLKGKGPGGADVLLAPRIILPKNLDDESIALIERFAELNPD